MTPITRAQIARIHILLGEARDFTDAQYRAKLMELFGVTSCKELSQLEADELIDWLDRLPKKGDTSEEPATKRQVIMLRDILGQCGMREWQAAKWARRLATHSGEPRPITHLAQLSKHEASLAIPAAQDMYFHYHGVRHNPYGPKRHLRPEARP